MGYEYETVSDDFIGRSLHERLSDHLYTHCYNLSAVLGDSDGKLNPSTAQQITNRISMVAPGIVLLGYTEAPNDTDDEYLGKETYVNEVSSTAYTMYTQYVAVDKSVVLETSNNTKVVSPLISLSTDQIPLVATAIGALYMDVMALYHELLKATPGTNLIITKQDLYRMDGNIRWITMTLEKQRYKSYDLIEVLRELQRTLMGIRNVNLVFSTTYSSRLSEMEFIEEV